MDRFLVANLPLFAGLSARQLDDVLIDARASGYAKNTAVFEQGEPIHSFFVLLHGHIRAVRTTPDGQQVVMRHVAPGDLFCVGVAAGLFRYPATAWCAVDSVVLAWPSKAWPRLVETHPALAANALRTVVGQVLEARARVVEMSTQPIERRIAHAVLRLARRAGRKVGEGVLIDFPVTRQDLAEMTGTTLYTVSRVLSAWEQRGLVEKGRRRVLVRRPHELAELADPDAE